MKSKKYLTIIVYCSLVIANCVYSEPVERVLTFDESIVTGIQNSQELLIAQEQASIAGQRVRESKALIYPKIDFNFSATQFRSDFPTVLSPAFGSLYLPPGSRDYYYSTRFSLLQYLYGGGRYSKNIELAEKNLAQSQAQSEAIRNKKVRDIRKAFYLLLGAKEKIKTHEGIYKNPTERSKMELKRLKYDNEKRKLSFLDTLGLELTTMIDVEGELKAPAEDYDLNKCLAWAIQHRPELRQTQFQEAINTLQVNLSQIERKTSVSLGANYEWSGGEFPLNDKNWNATINLNLPFFDGWASLARTRQRTHQEQESKIRRADIQDKVQLDVRQAYLDYAYWKEREAQLSAKKAEPAEIDRKLEAELQWIEAVQQLMYAHADLEWSIGGPLK